MALSQIAVGPVSAGDSSTPTWRGGKDGDGIVTQLHGRYYEQNYRGKVFAAGMVATSINAATFTTATTGATATPIIGLYNPAGSGVNAVLLLAQVGIYMTALQATGVGGLAWMAAAVAGPISTGITPINAKTLLAAGSQCKAMAGTALTGMTGTLAILRGSAMAGGSSQVAFLATQAGPQTLLVGAEEHFDGSLIVPPGAVVGLFGSVTPVGHSATSGLVWEEVAA